MKLQNVAAAAILAGLSAWSVHANASPAAGLMQADQLRPAPTAHVEPVYWGWRGGVRVWIGPRPYYPRPYYYRGGYGRPPYWWHGRGYWHRGWHQGGWRYW